MTVKKKKKKTGPLIATPEEQAKECTMTFARCFIKKRSRKGSPKLSIWASISW